MHYEYAVVVKPGPGALVDAVNAALKAGWELQGGVATAGVYYSRTDGDINVDYSQALKRKVE